MKQIKLWNCGRMRMNAYLQEGPVHLLSLCGRICRSFLYQPSVRFAERIGASCQQLLRPQDSAVGECLAIDKLVKLSLESFEILTGHSRSVYRHHDNLFTVLRVVGVIVQAFDKTIRVFKNVLYNTVEYISA